jgi:hypothetical protein
MPNFAPDTANFGDIASYGSFDIAHHREHLQFVQVLAGQSPAVSIPDFDFMAFLTAGQAQRSMLDSHQQAHALLRQITGVRGIDLSQVDLAKENDFDNWIGYHRDEHSAIRNALGIV